MSIKTSTRRSFLGSTVLDGAALPFAGSAEARPGRTGDFVYEIQRTEEEWRKRLSDFEYLVLRESGTEWAKSSDLWDDYREGEFHCRGCDMHVYSSNWRVELDKGWVFFSNAQPTNVLMD
ncbi:MAG: peptide-methionine (R)-S-oxide reductase, partial [Pseudomonadota bacterium]